MAKTETTLLLCNCERTMALDGAAIGAALGREPVTVHSHLCRSGIGAYEKAVAETGALCVACTQESPLFAEIAAEAGLSAPTAFNIREAAGWTADPAPIEPKVAALTAAALLDAKPARLKTIDSDGLCLVAGAGQAAFDAAVLLNRSLSVTLLLSAADDVLLPPVLDFPIFKGRLVAASGTLGSFDVTVDGYAPMMPSSRRQPDFAMARDGAASTCSVIVDLTGGTPLFTRHESRDGYLRPDPGDPLAVARALYDASGLVGAFEKPIYVGFDPEICAHSRSQKTGCSKCLDACPAGAIQPDGDVVAIDIDICGGCGTCAAHCPTGAVSYQYPDRADFIGRIQTTAKTYLEAGGRAPVLLLHDGNHGIGLINASARFGRGLPAHVIPLAMHATSGVGHDTLAAALGAGFRQIVVLADPKAPEEYTVLAAETALLDAILGGLGHAGGPVTVLSENDPDVVEAALWDLTERPELARTTFVPLGGKREVARAAIGALADAAPQRPDAPIPLPDSAPYGTVKVDTAACTLCLACVSACPADALRDNPETLQLRFVEAACVQCGICASTCPESAITLEPRLNLAPAAMQPIVLYEEEPFECIRCGTPFASRSTIERISEKLGGKHWMFGTDERVKLLQMCETCRLETLSEGGKDPFEMAEKPRMRTTDDYVEARKKGLSVDDFLGEDE